MCKNKSKNVDIFCHAASRKDGRAAARLVVGAGGEVWIRPDGRIGVRLL